MSTSPSWFDKDKFSRLVKKTVPKGGPAQAEPASVAIKQPVNRIILKAEAPVETPEQQESEPLPEQAKTPVPPAHPDGEIPISAEPSQISPVAAVKVFAKQNLMTSQPLSMGAIRVEAPPSLPDLSPEPIRAPAETSSISLTAKAPSLESPLPTLPRRTAPLPALKPVFQYEMPAVGNTPVVPPVLKSAPLPRIENAVPRVFISPLEENENPVFPLPVPVQSSDDLAAAWEKIAQLNEDLRKAGRERDQAVVENGVLREQLKVADEEQKKGEEGKASASGPDKSSPRIILGGDASTASVEDADRAIAERDQIRSQYLELREQFETVKQAQLHGRKDSEVDGAVRQQLTEREQELELLRTQARETEDDLRSQLTGKDSDIDGLKATAQTMEEALQKQLDERGKEIEALKSQSSQAGGAEEDLRRQLTERDRELDGLKTLAQMTENDLRKQIEDRDKQLDERTKEIESHKSQAGGAVEDLRKQIEDRDKQLDERNKELESHKSQASEAGGTVEDLRRQLTERGNEIDGVKAAAQKTEDDLRDQLTEKEKEVEALKSESAGVEDGFRKQMAEKEVEIEAAKAAASEMQDAMGNLKMALADVQEQLKKADEGGTASTALQDQLTQLKEEASVSQRGLALSQKALQETRDALREAQEASSQAKGSQDNLKKENSTLVQQNMLLQAQNDQVSRELSAAKAKLAAKG